MNEERREKEEYLEILWEMKEQGQDEVNDLAKRINGDYQAHIADELALEGLVELKAAGREIGLTERGNDQARQIIRAHRIGERLLFDVFGSEFETGACELEHTTTIELVDALCTLLGHPRECPHGMPIPEGECCRSSARTVHNVVSSLTELEIGQSARVAYINCRDDSRMHKLDGLQIRPGAIIKLHQRYPCYVVECEGASIAMDEEIVSSIRVWSTNPQIHPVEKKPLPLARKRSGWWRRGLK